MRIVSVTALALVIVGALNWGLVGLFEFDLVAAVVGEEFGATNALSRVVYVLVGLAGAYLAATVLPAMLRSEGGRASSERALRA